MQYLRRLFSDKSVEMVIRVGTLVGAVAGLFAFYSTYLRPLGRVDLSGLWEIDHRVTVSQDSRFVSLGMVFNFILVEDNSKIVGRGSKTRVSGAVVYDKERSILELDGYSDGSHAFLFYRERAEQNPERVVHGVIMWNILGRDAVDGTFDSSVAGVSGLSHGRRVKSVSKDLN
jgi:hypothetical protein